MTNLYKKTDIINNLPKIINNIPTRLTIFSPSFLLLFPDINQKLFSKPISFFTIEVCLDFLSLILDNYDFEFRLIYEKKKLEYYLNDDFIWEQLEFTTEYVKRRKYIPNHQPSLNDLNFNNLSFDTKVLKTNHDFWNIDEIKDNT